MGQCLSSGLPRQYHRHDTPKDAANFNVPRARPQPQQTRAQLLETQMIKRAIQTVLMLVLNRRYKQVPARPPMSSLLPDGRIWLYWERNKRWKRHLELSELRQLVQPDLAAATPLRTLALAATQAQALEAGSQAQAAITRPPARAQDLAAAATLALALVVALVATQGQVQAPTSRAHNLQPALPAHCLAPRPKAVRSAPSERSNNRGSVVWASSGLSTAASKIGATWAYDWSDNLSNSFSQSIPEGIGLVAISTAKSDLSSSASRPYEEVIGWNKPDGSAAPVNSSAAVAQWPVIISTAGKRMGSPAPAKTILKQGDWFYDFMTAITAAISHVDFICLHFYSPSFTDVACGVSDLQI
ncbi:hypothetical protein MMC28_004225 [Mycoblastus sanguinarius]|nr:hypothetical protein [Mycoblastus sanguinarius]